jgi:hypothetical protein
VQEYLTDDEYSELQMFLLANPDAGAVIPGSGGVRKLGAARTLIMVAAKNPHALLAVA